MDGKPVAFSSFLTSLEETLQTCSQESCAKFVCDAIVLFEKIFGPKNKAAMEMMIKEAVNNFGPDSTNQDIECMIPIYNMMRVYCEPSLVHEVLERVYEKDPYLRYSMICVERSRPHEDIANEMEISELGFSSKAEPACALNNEERGVLKLKKSSFVQENINTGQASCVGDLDIKELVSELSVERELFCEKSTNLVDSDNSSCDKWLSSIVSRSVCCHSSLCNFGVSKPSDETGLLYPDPNAENINPTGASSEITTRRKHAGILVSSLDFTLEDYDLGDDACTKPNSPELQKQDNNETNIKNNLKNEENGPSTSSIPPCPIVKKTDLSF